MSEELRPKFKGFANGRYSGGRRKPGVMNKTEERYAKYLDGRLDRGEILAWWFEPIRFKLGSDNLLTYLPDFGILNPDGSMEFIDTKGGPTDPKTIVKVKVAADRFFQFTFKFAKARPKKAGGGWAETVY